MLCCTAPELTTPVLELQHIFSSPWRAERLSADLRSTRRQLQRAHEQLNDLLSYLDKEAARITAQTAAASSFKSTAAAKAVAAVMQLVLYKCVFPWSAKSCVLLRQSMA